MFFVKRLKFVTYSKWDLNVTKCKGSQANPGDSRQKNKKEGRVSNKTSFPFPQIHSIQ